MGRKKSKKFWNGDRWFFEHLQFDNIQVFLIKTIKTKEIKVLINIKWLASGKVQQSEWFWQEKKSPGGDFCWSLRKNYVQVRSLKLWNPEIDRFVLRENGSYESCTVNIMKKQKVYTKFSWKLAPKLCQIDRRAEDWLRNSVITIKSSRRRHCQILVW